MPHWLLNHVSNLYDQVFQTFWTSSWVPLSTSGFPIPFTSTIPGLFADWAIPSANCFNPSCVVRAISACPCCNCNSKLANIASGPEPAACGDPGWLIVLDSDATTYPTSFLGKFASIVQWRQTSTAASWASWCSRIVAPTCATASQLVLMQHWVDWPRSVSRTPRSSWAIPWASN